MAHNKPEQEWTLPVIDSEIPVASEAPGIGSTGAWASYAIGAVTKNLMKQDNKKPFPFIDEDEHPAHLTLESSNNKAD
ncbi:MAG: hypothetical protein HKN88_07355 [Gammaproteobacteria bacterium]|nr:hypothetical protein [Gammaproteobacteria bacterium]NNC97875.1 hypothetical protein [Gammaproteobacteria bacterium]NNM13556.1 hypothetical protein [Gammaproteobacteria bacterium]